MQHSQARETGHDAGRLTLQVADVVATCAWGVAGRPELQRGSEIHYQPPRVSAASQ